MVYIPESTVTQGKFRNILIITSIYTGEPRGGSDRHTGELIRVLRTVAGITVLTTTALDYQTWESRLKPGTVVHENLSIIRFSPLEERNPESFNRYLTNLYRKKNKAKEDYFNFILKQGPVVPDLVKYVEQNGKDFDLVIFIGYLYYPIVFSLPFVRFKSIIVPTLHDEPPAYFPIYREIFTKESGYGFNTPEELGLFEKIYGFRPPIHEVVGICTTKPEVLVSFQKFDFPYVVYIGRIDQGKGIDGLIEYFKKWKNLRLSDIRLVMIGTGQALTSDGEIIILGDTPEKEKNSILKSSLFLINPSQLESFSIVLMEAWLLEVPVLVNGNSSVLKNHCIRSNGGLYYTDEDSFIATMSFFLNNPSILKKMGKNGFRYVSDNYSDSRILEKFQSVYSKLTMNVK